jgi:hypothetical protein
MYRLTGVTPYGTLNCQLIFSLPESYESLNISVSLYLGV